MSFLAPNSSKEPVRKNLLFRLQKKKRKGKEQGRRSGRATTHRMFGMSSKMASVGSSRRRLATPRMEVIGTGTVRSTSKKWSSLRSFHPKAPGGTPWLRPPPRRISSGVGWFIPLGTESETRIVGGRYICSMPKGPWIALLLCRS